MDIIFDPQMTIGDMYALECLARQAHPDRALEVGSWKGLSASIIARFVGTLVCVDTWRGADSTPEMAKEAQNRDIKEVFLNNMTALGLMARVIPVQASSQHAVSFVKDNELDFVFLDGDHAYEAISNDIKAWIRKVRPGGILCGHDCEILWKHCTDDQKYMIDSADPGADFLIDALEVGMGIHPGVTKAIRDHLEDAVTVIPGSSIWWMRKPKLE